MINFLKLNLALFLVFSIVPTLILGECTCDPVEDGDQNKALAKKYKIVALVSILTAGAIGVCLPVVGKSIPALRPEKEIFFVIKAFAAGVILATGFIHVLPDAMERLTSPCLSEDPWGKFPFSGFVAMVSAIGCLMIDCFATSFYSNTHLKKEAASAVHGDSNKVDAENATHEGHHDEGHAHLHVHGSHGHSHGPVVDGSGSDQLLLRHRILTQVLELGIVVHSVIIGISLGASESPSTVRPLVAAITFHQFFEGLGLGGCISQAKFKASTAIYMVIFFSLTTPIGIAIGMGIASGYNEDSPRALIVQGLLDSASAGILIYLALVDLLAADFMNPKVQNSGVLQLGVNVALLLGAGFMSLLAKWA
ncbi:hypothetical protein Tsubulata_005619 [Turnera subulata]|uniref:Uncharacterized protein n=1 Tax=Turnera subulata TaxID=218843 RepID=A0A9Q0JPR6_9ROSI|nr:hypothetical protein Tsubulata_005619 [Turnera subulata]